MTEKTTATANALELDEFLWALKRRCDAASYKGAVCDMLGWRDADGLITETSSLRRRFELRSKAHVEVYGFKTIYRNYED